MGRSMIWLAQDTCNQFNKTAIEEVQTRHFIKVLLVLEEVQQLHVENQEITNIFHKNQQQSYLKNLDKFIQEKTTNLEKFIFNHLTTNLKPT